MKEAVIVSVARTPMAKYRGDFADLNVPELAAIPMKAVVEKVGLDPRDIDEVIMGNLLGSDWGNPARASVLTAGFPVSVPAITVDRQCASSLNAIGLAASMIKTGMADVIIAGGVESYSQMPFYIRHHGSSYPNALEFTDYKTSIEGYQGNLPMIITAENVASKYGITREECDVFAMSSHHKATKAWDAGCFDAQVVPVDVPQKKGISYVVKTDACVRRDCTMEALSVLSPVLKADGVVTAGNSSPQNDGASAVLLMSREKARDFALEPLAFVREYCSAGCDPTLMGIGPVYSTRRLMEKTGCKINDFDLVELNEAFAAQCLPCIRELGIRPERVNVEGGAIAIGHPNGASGGMLVGRMVYALRRRNLRRGLVTFCCGGGQGFSLIIENAQI